MDVEDIFDEWDDSEVMEMEEIESVYEPWGRDEDNNDKSKLRCKKLVCLAYMYLRKGTTWLL